jgi:diguanylate cyclase (GGDEF)-like protein/PAS domain S-box-containing protein
MGPARRIRGHAAAFPWRQLLTIAAGIAVIAAMVTVAETARRDEEHHQRIQVLVQQVQASSSALGEFAWQWVAASSVGGKQNQINPSTVLNQGLRIWGSLSTAVNALRVADQSPLTRALLNDANRLYDAGLAMLPTLNHLPSPATGISRTRAVFTPTLDALDRDSARASAAQQRVAHAAAKRAGIAYVGSLIVGVGLLMLLGLQLDRISRRTIITEERRSLERRTEDRVRALVENSSDIITVVAPDLIVRWQSPSVTRTLGRAVSDVVGRKVTSLVHPDDSARLENQFSAVTTKPGTVTVTARFHHSDGGWRHLEVIAESRVSDPAIEGVVLSMRDITDRKTLEDELRRRAFHDALTGLANRALFEDRLAQALARARRQGQPVAVLFLDLDDFKTINDSLGHSSGDELLRAVATRIADVARITDTAARLGGDEFAVLLELADDKKNAELVARRLLEGLAPPIVVGERELRVGASIGVAVSNGALTVDEILRNADTAMYAAKDAGKGTVRVFETGMHKRVLDRLELSGELQRAIDTGEMVLDYQPIVDIDHGRMVGCEALVRWSHPVRGRLSPSEFIDLAEDTGLIVPLGAWVLDTACGQAARWQRTFPALDLTVSVNVSTRQLRDPSFPSAVADAVHDHELEPGLLTLEITESLLPDDSDRIITFLSSLKNVGVRVAVDDFGTGYSALSRLRAYPVDILKIDRSFITGIERDASKAQLVRGIVNLADSLHIRVVAEGIERYDQLKRLRRMGSPLGQGFLFSPPVSPDAIEDLLHSGRPLVDDAGPVRRAMAG